MAPPKKFIFSSIIQFHDFLSIDEIRKLFGLFLGDINYIYIPVKII